MSIEIPLGFRFAGIATGIKKAGGPDLALVVSDRACTAAAVFTRNAFPAAPVLYDRALLHENPAGLRAVVINAGCANACTGDEGYRDAAEMAGAVEGALGLPASTCAVMSTGVIGPRLPMAKIRSGVAQAATRPSTGGWDDASRAIMTTDTRPKVASRRVGHARVFGMAKGAGMIHPDMATMLSIIVTDAAAAPVSVRPFQSASWRPGAISRLRMVETRRPAISYTASSTRVRRAISKLILTAGLRGFG